MDLVSLIRQKRQTLISIFLIFLVIGLLFVLTQEFKYGTKSKLLVIQEGAGRVDPFSVSRSVEYLSDLLTRVVHSNSFFEDVMNSDFDIDTGYFGPNSIKQMKTWKKTVSAKSLDDSGIININVYHKDNYQASQIALAVNHVLIAKHQSYHGLGSSVKISVIDQPVSSAYPVKPNLPLALVIIIAVSLFFGLIYIYIFPERKYDIHFFGQRNNSQIRKKGGSNNLNNAQNYYRQNYNQENDLNRINNISAVRNFNQGNYPKDLDDLNSLNPISDSISRNNSNNNFANNNLNNNLGNNNFNNRNNQVSDRPVNNQINDDREQYLNLKKSGDIDNLFQ